MALSATAIVQGTVQRVESRVVPKKGKDGEPTAEVYVFNNVLVVGQHCLAEIRIPDGTEVPAQGARVTMLVKLSAYRDDAECTLIEYVELAK